LRPSLLSNWSSIVDRVTRGFLVPYLNALSNPSQYYLDKVNLLSKYKIQFGWRP
jgi:hypothetical protein